MKQRKLLLLLTLFIGVSIFTSCSDDDEDNNKKTQLITFNLTEKESEFKTEEGEKQEVGSYPNYTLYKSSFNDSKNLITFSHYYTSEFGFAGGFTYTNKTDTKTPDYTNLSAITAKGKSGDTYLTGTTGKNAEITIDNTDYAFKEVWVTNTAYAYLVIKEGSKGTSSMPGKDFVEGDYFKLIVTGSTEDGKKVGSLDFYLADYRDGKKEIVNEWKRLDLSPLREATKITFTMDGTDKNEYGLVTPQYFCLDALTLIEK